MGYMTDGLTFNVLRSANIARLPLFRDKQGRLSHPNGADNWSVAEWFTAMAGEVGEAGNLIKKIFRGDFGIPGRDPTTWDLGLKLNVAKELADVAIYLDLLAHRCGINLGQAVMEKWNEVSERVGAPIRIDADDWHYTRAR
jgi:NTP pyrophosphatase (non-canonical NTP hydrolase)